jgi:DNA-binding NarL/FixJ family response regulator
MNQVQLKETQMKLKVLVVDDTDSMRMLVVQYLQRLDSVLVVGEASNGEEAVSKARELSPDLVLMDISLSGTSGVEVTRKIKSTMPNVRVYLFSAYDADEFSDLTHNSPADGFIQKSFLKKELMDMVRKELERKKT